MRHFPHLSESDMSRLFVHPPASFTRDAGADVLAVALGASLYMPANRPALADDLVRQARNGVVSSVLCLEDAVSDDAVPAAQANLVSQLRSFADRVTAGADGVTEGGSGPLVFVRVRSPEQITAVTAALGEHIEVLSGFVLPKFTEATGEAYLETLEAAGQSAGRRLFGMPVIESPEVIFRETRTETLLGIQKLLSRHRQQVLAVRLGATDLCSAYGLRRARDLTIYDVHLVAQVITDVVNILGRADDSGFVITGPVWEYFSDGERIFKPQLRESPFAVHHAESLRRRLVTRDLDALIREVVLDKANGLTGKTVIHPSHVPAVHSLLVVTHEEFTDATDILVAAATSSGGVQTSAYRNKMNENRPHRAWAQRTLRRAEMFGVAGEGISVVDLLAASSGA